MLLMGDNSDNINLAYMLDQVFSVTWVVYLDLLDNVADVDSYAACSNNCHCMIINTYKVMYFILIRAFKSLFSKYIEMLIAWNFVSFYRDLSQIT